MVRLAASRYIIRKGLPLPDQYCLCLLFRRLSVQFHGRDAHTGRLHQINLGARLDRNNHLHSYWSDHLLLCWWGRWKPRYTLQLQCGSARRFRRRLTGHLHLRQHQYHRRRQIHHGSRLPQFRSPLREHEKGMDDLAGADRRTHGHCLGHRRSDSVLQCPLGHHLQSVQQRLHIYLPRPFLVLPHQGRQMECHQKEHRSLHSERSNPRDWFVCDGLWHICKR